jgi:hypothetical protein
MKRLSKQLNKNLLVLIVGILLMATSAFAIENIIPPDFTEQAIEQGINAQKTGGKADLGPFVRASVLGQKLPNPKAGINGSIRGALGPKRFTGTDVDRVMVPFSTSNGPGLSSLFHDGGEWPGYGGDPNVDDGNASGVALAEEIYDYDGNGHYPKAVLRHVGTHCYIFVPVMFFPTLPVPLSNSEEITPKAQAEWGMTWHHNPNLYYSPDSGGNVREPRFILGADKASARLTLSRLATKFDTEIYPEIRNYLGNEPDVDGDSKIYIFLDDIREPTGGFLGYFWAGNQFSKFDIPLSNEKEMLYIDIHNFVDYPSEAYGTVAHEFAHMIMFNEGYYVEDGELKGLETWVEEGVTTFVEHKFTGHFSPNLDMFIEKPDTRLVDDRSSVWLGNNPYANYGASFLFMYYICEKYGHANVPNFLKTIIRAREGGGIGNIEAALRPHNNIKMKDVFVDWAIANSLNKTTKKDLITPLNNGKWGYLVDNDQNINNDIGYNRRLPVNLSETMLLSTDSTTRSSAVNPWAADYIRIHGNNGKLNVAFDGDDRGMFAAALIKQGPQVDTDVEILYLNDKQAGNVVVQNYGTSSTYENLTLIPVQTGNYSDQPLSYVYSGTFADLKVAVFPNPMFENHLHVVVRSESKFSSEPRVQMTYDGAQWYMVMSPIDDSTYIANYSLKNSGEGTLVASGANASGVILSNSIKFSAVYYPPRSAGSLSSSFVRLNIPEGALTEGGLVVAATGENPISYGGITRVSPSIDVALPSEPSKNIQLLIPIKSQGEFAADKLGIYRSTGDGLRWVSAAKLEDGKAVSELNFSGTVFAAYDDTPPLLDGEPEGMSDGWTKFNVVETGSGIDEKSIRVLCGGKQVPTKINEAGQLLANTSAFKKGSYDFDIGLKDNAGNVLAKRLSGAVLGVMQVEQVVAYPNPAKNRSTIRAELAGGSAASAEVSVRLYDVSGHRVLGQRSMRQGKAGIYEYVWDLRNDKGALVANGVYFAEITVKSASGSSKNRLKLAVLK